MPHARRITTALIALSVSGLSFSPVASAHQGDGHHHHHNNSKNKAYNNGYRRGYRRGVRQNVYRPYRAYRPYYRPVRVRRPVVVAPSAWIAPAPVVVRPYRYRPVHPRVNVGVGFTL